VTVSLSRRSTTAAAVGKFAAEVRRSIYRSIAVVAARHAGLVDGRPTARRSNMLAYNTAVISNRKLKSITFGEKQVCCERCGYSNYNISQKCVHVHITVYVTHSLVVTGT